jgi:hypothetical protein
VEAAVRPGMSVEEASNALRGRFEVKAVATGISLIDGVTKVHDFSSAVSEVRLISKRESIISVRVAVPHAPKA